MELMRKLFVPILILSAWLLASLVLSVHAEASAPAPALWSEDPFWRFLQRAVVISKRGIRSNDLHYFFPDWQPSLSLEDSRSPLVEMQKSLPILRNHPIQWALKAKLKPDDPRLILSLKLKF